MTTDQTAGYVSLGSDINKVGPKPVPETQQGIVSPKLPELTLEMENSELIKLTTAWNKQWTDSDAKTRWEKMCDENEKYWLGEHFDTPRGDKNRPNVDNLIFESLETYLPQVTRRNPEPLVSLAAGVNKDDPTNQKYVTKVKDKLGDIADDNVIRLKLKRAARHWSIYLIGVAKMGWDLDRDIPIVRIIRPKKMILDPEATVDEDGYTGNHIGEHRKMEAERILAIMGEETADNKEAISKIKEKVGENLATEIGFIEWWTPSYMCWTMDGHVLRKTKNIHWNYDKTEETEETDDYGNVTPGEKTMTGVNHLPSPAMPYEFLVVFNLGDQPVDRTSLIGQNLANQDRINKRNRQIDANADNMNEGMVVSLARSGLTEAQGKRVTAALRKGGVVCIPDGNPQEAIYKPPVTGLPADIYNDLSDMRSRMRDIFGTRGSTPAGIESESTVRGKIISRGLDTDRIGGGVSEYLEQFADRIYNWMLQLLYVYDEDFQFLGDAKPPKVRISVKEGSLLPKDSTTIANQAIELATGGKMSTLDMYKRLEYPNPEELAANVWLEANAPEILYREDPRIMEALQIKAQTAQADAEMKAQEGETEHTRGMEKEVVRGAMKQGVMPSGDPMAEVPLDAGVPSG